MTTHTEIESKFDAPEGAALPDLSAVGVRLGDPEQVQLEATYFDTADLRLAGRRITLRRRTGGADEGWHLKLPAGPEERLEVRRPLGRSATAVPKPLLAQVRAIVRDEPLKPVAVLRTTRVERHLLDSNDTDLAILADDTVHAERLSDGQDETTTWREIEVELTGGDRELLAAVSPLLSASGFTPSPSASKLARVLGDQAAATTPRRNARGRTAQTAGAVLVCYLHEQVDELVARDRDARADRPDGVHKMRVAARRLRSALATYRPVLDRAQSDPVRAELKWLGQVLGRARDAEVQSERLYALVDDLPKDLLLGPVHRRVSLEMRERHRTAHQALVVELNGARYLRLLDALDGLVAQPALTKRAAKPAGKQLPSLVSRAVRRVDAAAKQAAVASGEERSTALHEVRKAAKRARYAAESAAPLVGKPASLLAARMEAVQETLGEAQDSATARRLLRELGVAAHGAGENGFTFGLMHREEMARGFAAEAGADKALRKAAAPAVRRWLG